MKETAMTHLAQAPAIHTVATATSSPGFIERLRTHFARMEAALSMQSHLSQVTPEMLSDTGLSAEDLTGAPTHDPALPFFLQAGFGRHER
jgi:hypothetical protein